MDIISYSKAAKAMNKANTVEQTLTSEALRLDGRCDNLQNVGRYLSLWNCQTGKPTTNPTIMPYTYKAGDYYRIGITAAGIFKHSVTISGGYVDNSTKLTINFYTDSDVQITSTANLIAALFNLNYTSTQTACYDVSGKFTTAKYPSGQSYFLGKNIDYVFVYYSTPGDESSGRFSYGNIEVNNYITQYTETFTVISDTVTSAVKYKPNGSTYNDIASSTVETEGVVIGDVYFYDGTTWSLQINHALDVYTKTEINTFLSGKSSTTHNHDGVYAKVVSCTQAQYDALATKDANTLYCITG